MSDELTLRRTLILKSIEMIEAHPDTDPRKPEALEFYKAQLVEIDEMIANKPQDIVIKLKPGTVGAAGPSLGK